ncbi:hypothetical protein MON38_09405 [Hymenobacter sp. DH14]|uniref:Uncharacterized protein n=1 Tax=Hymenobacter cyanobacteriorum TaxID=2926463 RepID=A0A9X1VEV2_9BACT|nr:hypothetical protein [Hymenobacter cyanobacteriorum]MCI1187636.1 hypothetical protein [Hymenobacter cyanobacteriorum]
MILLRLRFYTLMGGALAGLLATGCVRKQFFQPDARLDATAALPAAADSVRNVTAGRHYARHGGLYNALVGRHHRPSWAAPVAAPVFNMRTARPGGLRPGKVGGGFNSTSLNLTAPDGRAYVIRTVDKDPIRATPMAVRGTFLVNVLRDNVSSTNPYAALLVPPLARAAGVPRSSPQLFYVRPDDPAFQTDSLVHFRGQLAYLEEKAALAPERPAPAAVVNSVKAFGSLFASPARRFDQPALLRARLLDAWLGDWDRHAGQWSWAVDAPAPGGFAPIRPLPKDRDMVIYRLDDGVLGWLIGHVIIRHWVTFGPRYKAPVAQLSNGEYLDRRALNQLTRAQFQAAARDLQRRLPDSVIERAMRRLPPAVYALEGPRTLAAFQARRDHLPALAETFYRELARQPRIAGTNEAERFEIHRYADSTVVAVFPAKGTATFYRRAFVPTETKRIQLEGLGGDDVFVIENHGPVARCSPAIRIYGGLGTDELRQPGSGVRFEQDSVPAGKAFDKLPEE